MKSFQRKHLCIPGLLARVRSQYQKIQDRAKQPNKHNLLDCLLSGLSLFGLKYPSLLQFDQDARGGCIEHNIKQLWGVSRVPSDTSLRQRLDPLDPKELQKGIDRIIAQLQRGKVLEMYRYVDDYLLVAIDGTGYFLSHEIHCKNCCVKTHRDGTKTYYHQMLSAVIVHPDYHQVFPVMIEPITYQDGATKNDCEHNAAKRLLVNLRRAHPHLKVIVTLDGLYADGCIVELLKELEFRFIITGKESDLTYLYEFYRAAEKSSCLLTRQDNELKLTWVNGLPLNATHHDYSVNVLNCREKRQKKKKLDELTFGWITDLLLDTLNVERIQKGGRARWRIENETFNTLKNQGYAFEHNFGHGYENLSTVLAYLMFTAFLIDQVQEFSCKHFQKALKKIGRLKYFWERMRSYFFICYVDSWQDLYDALATEATFALSQLLTPDTS